LNYPAGSGERVWPGYPMEIFTIKEKDVLKILYCKTIHGKKGRVY
jgi:hypothetical protein